MAKNKLKPVMRTDLLVSNMTAIKEAQLRDVLIAYQRGAVLIAKEANIDYRTHIWR